MHCCCMLMVQSNREAAALGAVMAAVINRAIAILSNIASPYDQDNSARCNEA